MTSARAVVALALSAVALAACGGSGSHRLTGKLPARARVVYASDRPADVGHVASANTPGTLVASIPFDPLRDGFAFENYGFIAGSTEIDQHVLRELFGNAVCATAPSDSCTLIPAAQQWAQAVDGSALGGHCYGFSVTALRFFTHRLAPAPFGASSPYALSLTPALANEIAYGYAMQMLPSVTSAALTGTPSEIITDLEKAFADPSAEVYTLAFFNGNSASPEGHAVTPFGIEDLGGGKYEILIYDNNYPGTTQAVSVDTVAETWSYNVSPNPTDPSTLWSGQGTNNEMMLMPLFPGLGVQPCPFCASVGALGAMVQVSLGGDPDSHGHLLIVSNGRRLGFVDGHFVDQITGARVIRPLLSEDWKAHPEPIYEVPAGTKLSVTVRGAPGTALHPVSVHVVGPGFGATVANLLLGPTSSEQIAVAAAGGSISVRSGGPAPGRPPTVQLARDRGRGGDELMLTPRSLAAGTELGMSLAPASNQIMVTSSASTQPVALTVRTVGPSGTTTAQKSSVALTPGRPATFSLGLFRIG